jgi:GNAT-like C-terminal domain/N-acyltransferase N-terminal domain
VRSLVELRFDDDADRDDPVVQTFLARIPEARRLHAARGLTDEESWRTLRDLPRHARLDRLLYGTPGLRKGWWVELAFSGRLFELGRLQFEPTDGFLSIHIPEEGPLTPAAVDASLERARELFPEYSEARCSSWLLDPQLAVLLPARSNIVSFQHRFEPIANEGVEPRVLEFVFHAFDPDLERLPRDTTLQRVIVDHLRGGGHLDRVTGTLAL